MEALSGKTVLLVTHQVDFLPAFHCCIVSTITCHTLVKVVYNIFQYIFAITDNKSFLQLMTDGEVLHAGPYHELLASSKEFSDLVNAHKETAGTVFFYFCPSSSRLCVWPDITEYLDGLWH